MKRVMSACPFCHADTQTTTLQRRTYVCGSHVNRKTGIYEKNRRPKVKSPCSQFLLFSETEE